MGCLSINPGLMSRNTPEWGTPKNLFDALHQEFGFTIDVAADARNAKVAKFYTKDDDGLKQPWAGRVWCNPPWSDGEVSAWLKRGLDATTSGEAEVAVYLLPARTDPAWWHDFVMKSQEVRLIRGRLKFIPTDGLCTAKGKVKRCPGPCRGHSAPFPCAVVVFRATRQEPLLGVPRQAAEQAAAPTDGPAPARGVGLEQPFGTTTAEQAGGA